MTKNKPLKKDKSLKNKDKPKVNPELQGFDVEIDSFGEIKSNYNIDRINEFLNKNVEDKKLKDRDDIKSTSKSSDKDDDEAEDLSE